MTSSAHDDVDRLRLALARARAGPHGDPVDPEQLWRAVRGQAEPAEVAALVDRMAHDAALAEDWRVAVAFARAAREDEDAAKHDDVPASPPGAALVAANDGGRARWGGVVVALVAAAVLLVVAWPRAGLERYEGDGGALRGAEGGITARQGEGPLARDHATLEWSPVPGALRYELYVSTPALEPVLVERALPGPSMVLPAAILRSLPAGAELLWRVEAVLDDEQRVASPTFSLTVIER
jgi:hypothetical protein